jgi:hypothetical protein
MGSTIIAVLLASAVLFWHSPFSFKPIWRIVHRRWRWALLSVLLTALGSTKTHTATALTPTVDCDSMKTMPTCKRS